MCVDVVIFVWVYSSLFQELLQCARRTDVMA